MTIPPLTPEERQAALKKAAAARQVRAQVKKELREGETSLATVISRAVEDEAIGRMRVIDVVKTLPSVGEIRAKTIMERLGIAESRRLRGLGVHQAEALKAEFAERKK